MTAGSQFNDGEWQEVSFKDGGRNNNGQGSSSKVRVTKFFVSNLPRNCSSQDLVWVFKEYGQVEVTYIARKLDRLGKQFGFVSFRNVTDPKRLEGEMGDVWLGSYKLFIVIARFVDGEKGREDKSDQRKVYMEKKTVVDKPVVDKTVGTEPFCDILTNKKQAVDYMVIKIIGNVNAFVNWYEYALVGRVKEFKILTSLRQLLKEFGYNRVDIKYVGRFRVMLDFHDAELLTYFKESEDVWNGWFEYLEGWEGQSF
ncbi:putative RNA recognition motif domain, nucleotide-binding alpha-beta plait domain superfamily [Helianthus annuus]|uniref:RNA recognition motif domain, nucleotide-binding alpha-beta plait domain superfamily n=1 Tax=Helianthus annuus TaxID=4232 RepID=A0A9K3HY41_HELAN|nr:putative RNA recognition motif domain, nucleotide-binding alpha-beta plait domain superfamily [Helianthus annuus]